MHGTAIKKNSEKYCIHTDTKLHEFQIILLLTQTFILPIIFILTLF